MFFFLLKRATVSCVFKFSYVVYFFLSSLLNSILMFNLILLNIICVICFCLCGTALLVFCVTVRNGFVQGRKACIDT